MYRKSDLFCDVVYQLVFPAWQFVPGGGVQFYLFANDITVLFISEAEGEDSIPLLDLNGDDQIVYMILGVPSLSILEMRYSSI